MSLFESVNKNLNEAEKRTFRVYIEEVVSEEFEVEASDEGEAFEIAEEKYRDGEFVLEPGNLESTSIAVEDPETGDLSSFVEI